MTITNSQCMCLTAEPERRDGRRHQERLIADPKCRFCGGQGLITISVSYDPPPYVTGADWNAVVDGSETGPIGFGNTKVEAVNDLFDSHGGGDKLMREKITFENNQPVEVALEFAQGKIMPGRFGDQVMYSLQGQRVMFLDLAVSQKINMLAPAVGETFFICKRPKNGSVPVRWDLWLSPATEQLRALKESPGAALRSPAVPTSQLEQQLDASLRQVQERRAALPSRRPPTAAIAAPILGTGTNGPVAVPSRVMALKTTYGDAMAEFLIMAGRATRSAETTLGAEGGSVRFDSRDVAALATTLLIQACKQGEIVWRD